MCAYANNQRWLKLHIHFESIYPWQKKNRFFLAICGFYLRLWLSLHTAWQQCIPKVRKNEVDFFFHWPTASFYETARKKKKPCKRRSHCNGYYMRSLSHAAHRWICTLKNCKNGHKTRYANKSIIFFSNVETFQYFSLVFDTQSVLA